MCSWFHSSSPCLIGIDLFICWPHCNDYETLWEAVGLLKSTGVL